MIASLLHQRSCSHKNAKQLHDNLATYASRDKLTFESTKKIVSPHPSRISSLDIDNNAEGRFLLCGSRDCTISIYDLSLLGSEYHVNFGGRGTQIPANNEKWKLQNTYHPICHSRKVQSNPSQGIHEIHQDPNYLPTGHGSPVTQVQWYPVDSGIFISSDCLGNILLWDSNAFIPASCMSLSKTATVNGMMMNSNTTSGSWSHWDSLSMSSHCSINTFDLPKNSSHHMQLAAGCIQTNFQSRTNAMQLVDDRAVYLCDIKSGSTTQQLIGHGSGHGQYGNRGISSVQWSPMNEFVLISGGGDGCIKLWDVRKSGSTACLTTLDQEMKFNSEKLEEYDRSKSGAGFATSRNKRRKLHIQESIAPGNYSKVECSSQIQSHVGPVIALSFTPDGEYVVSASAADGIHVWHIQKGNDLGILMPTNFLGPHGSMKHPLRRKQRKVPIAVTQPGSSKSGTVWIGTEDLLGFDIHGMGGGPSKVLSGHIDTVTAIASQENSMRIFTGGADGMVLGWGYEMDESDEEYDNTLNGIS